VASLRAVDNVAHYIALGACSESVSFVAVVESQCWPSLELMQVQLVVCGDGGRSNKARL
jgi:hypothetical protein